jgi:DNA mismatch repair ATPase MutS
MTSSELKTFYRKRKTDFASVLEEAKKNINIVSNLRVGAAIIFLVCVYLAFSNLLFIYGAAATLALFIFLVARHSALFDKKVHLENLVRLNQLEERSLSGDYSDFYPGREFVDAHHPYTHDLDIFGDGSLFQAINRCHTFHGKAYMAERLSQPLDSVETIYAEQDAIRELSSRIDFRQHFQASGMEIGELPQDRDELLRWTQQPLFIYNSWVFKYVLIILPIVTIGAVVASFFFAQVKPLAILLVLSQWAILGLYMGKISVFHEQISRKKNILEKFARLLHYFQKEEFNSTVLKNLSAQAREADIKVNALASLVSYLNARLNLLTNIVINSLLLYDLQCVYRLEKWKQENAGHLKKWLDVINETEVLGSIGTFAFNHATYVYPKINSELSIRAKDLGHPMLSAEECVPNDLYIGEGQSVLIITGANMAGKSTFLRTSGVNLVLALTGAPVFATEYSCPIINLRSGMRTADSLKDHQSYFYAELNRLKSIMDELRSDKPLFILLDEILKGTNSTDKQSGSIALLKQLLPHPCLAMIATHDIVLGELESEYPNHIRNYCFEANIENDQLSFDYKIKPGVAQKMNATFLMKKMGIIGV